jgi:hypothetical protein
MQTDVGTYLDEVRTHLHLDPRTERRVLSELYTHFQEKVGDLQLQGMPEREASREAISSFGESRAIARLMYEAHSRGSWVEAFIGCQPHLFMAALFATHFWRNPLLLAAAFAAITCITLFGWRGEKPNWLYSWAGYSLFPLFVLVYLSLEPIGRTVTFFACGTGTPAALWYLTALGAFYAFAIWLVASTTLLIAKRDWILVTLMFLPLPAFAIWMVSLSQADGVIASILAGMEAGINRWDGAMAYFFLTLGVTSAVFIRLRQRLLKAIIVISIGMVSGAIVASRIRGSLGFVGTLGVSLCLLVFLISPFLLHAFSGREGSPQELP